MSRWIPMSSTPFKTLRDQLLTLQTQYEEMVREETAKLKAYEEDLKKLGG